MPPHLCTNPYDQKAPAGTMALCAHPTIPSNLTQEQASESETGILHATSLDTHLTLYYWITTWYISLTFTKYRREAGYDTIYFTLFSLEAEYTGLYPDNPISNTISVRLYDTTPPTFPSLDLSMSTSPTPTSIPCRNDAKPSPWPIRPETHHAI